MDGLFSAAKKHCGKAVKVLGSRLDEVRERADTGTWETSFMACYLFTELLGFMGDEKGAGVWLRKGFRVLKGESSFSFRLGL